MTQGIHVSPLKPKSAMCFLLSLMIHLLHFNFLQTLGQSSSRCLKYARSSAPGTRKRPLNRSLASPRPANSIGCPSWPFECTGKAIIALKRIVTGFDSLIDVAFKPCYSPDTQSAASTSNASIVVPTLAAN